MTMVMHISSLYLNILIFMVSQITRAQSFFFLPQHNNTNKSFAYNTAALPAISGT